MNKQEAILAMQEGKKVTHRYLYPNKWMAIMDGMIVLEKGFVDRTEDFWRWRTDPAWNDGYELFNE